MMSQSSWHEVRCRKATYYRGRMARYTWEEDAKNGHWTRRKSGTTRNRPH